MRLFGRHNIESLGHLILLNLKLFRQTMSEFANISNKNLCLRTYTYRHFVNGFDSIAIRSFASISFSVSNSSLSSACV